MLVCVCRGYKVGLKVRVEAKLQHIHNESWKTMQEIVAKGFALGRPVTEEEAAVILN